MNEKNEYLYSNIKDPIHWRVSEIILEQSSKHPNLKIIKFIDGPEWTYNDLNACNNYKDGVDAAKSIEVPALAVLAKNDQMTPLKSGLKFVDLIKTCETHVLDCGHFLQSERPNELNSLLQSYLKKL